MKNHRKLLGLVAAAALALGLAACSDILGPDGGDSDSDGGVGATTQP